MLEMFFGPRSVAVIGAAREPGKLGYGVLRNIQQHGYRGSIYPINPKAQEILGLRCYPSVLAVPHSIDLAVIVIPNRLVASVLDECGRKGVKGVIVISAGFREAGGDGIKMEKELTSIAQKYGMRMVGPNCLGIIDTVCDLNASFAAGMPDKGGIAFMSQSGALCSSILDWARAEGVGFSRFVSLGNKADVNEIDMLLAWDKDSHSKVIAAYLEGVVDGPRFMETARQVTKSTPVIAIKSGGTAAGSRAVSSHTGTLAGTDAAYDAAFAQCGIIRANSIEDLLDYSVAFARQPLLKSNRIAVVTNAGGPGIMATDACERSGMKLATLSRETVEFLRPNLPPSANVYNPIDVLGDALADRYALAVEAALGDPNVDGVLVILTPQVMTRAEETAEAVGQVSRKFKKPVLGGFMGEVTVRPAIGILRKYGIPNYLYPERAMAAFQAMYYYRQWLERPPQEYPRYNVDQAEVRRIFARTRGENRLSLGEVEAREVFGAYGLVIPQSRLTKTPEEAVLVAEGLGYPVVMKIASPDILHKSDIGAVKVGVADASGVRDAFELITYRATRYMPDADIWGVSVQQMVPKGREVVVGMSRDPQFGPLIMFGMGGIYVEVLKDVVFRVAPVSRQEAMEMVQQIHSFPLLKGVRGERPADLAAITDAILRVSQLVADFPEIAELDINPLMVHERGAVAVDMRMVIT
jgi:acetyltransferase